MANEPEVPYLTWKCRMCGVQFNESLPQVADNVRSLLYDRNERGLDTLHTCNDEGDLGVCDLLGGRWQVDKGCPPPFREERRAQRSK